MLEFFMVAMAYYLGQTEYRQFSLSLLTLIPSFVFNHFFSQLQKSPKHNIIPLGLDLLVVFFLLFINGGRENPLYLVLLLHIFIAPFYLKKSVALVFSLLTLSALTILPFSPFHFRPLSLEVFPDLNFPFIPILIGGLVFWIFSSWLVDEIKTLNHYVQNSIKLQYRADRYRSLGLLTAGICHELGTPLHTLEMRLNQLKKKTQSSCELSKACEKDFEVLLRNTQKCSHAIKKLNAQAHENSGREGLEHCAPIAGLKEMIRVFDNKLSFEWEGRSKTLDYDPNIEISEVLYTRCMLELFENSCEAGADKIKIRVTWGQQLLILDIIDNGEGMGEEVLKHLGQPFVSSKQRGSGLGLYHIINTIDYIGGQFKVMPKASPKVGTWIQLHFPLALNSKEGEQYA